MRYIIIDLQGFRVSGMFIPKELATLSCDWKTSHFIFEPPMPYKLLSSKDQRTTNFLTDYHHTLNWEIGYTSSSKINDIIHYLTRNYDKVYVRGLEKSNYVKQLVGNRISVEAIDGYSQKIERQVPLCPFHEKDLCICAVNNVYALKPYCDLKLTDEDMFVNK